MYADDSQIYTSVAVSDITSAVHCLAHCIADVNNWISDSSLRFNPSNFQDGDHVAGRGASAPTSWHQWHVLSSTVRVVQSAREFGVILDSQLSLSAHIAVLCRAGFYQLRQIRPAIRSFTPDAARTIVQAFIQAFITCRLDWYNSLLYGVPENLFRKVQSASQCRTLPLVCSPAHADVTTFSATEVFWHSGALQIGLLLLLLHHSGVASVTLAAGPETTGIQDGVSCTPVASFTCTDLPDCWHSSRLRVWSPPPALVDYW